MKAAALCLVVLLLLPSCAGFHIPLTDTQVQKWCQAYQSGYARVSIFLDALEGIEAAALPLLMLNSVHGTMVALCARPDADPADVAPEVAKGARALAELLELTEARIGPTSARMRGLRTRGPREPEPLAITVDPDGLIRQLRRVESQATAEMAR